MLKIEQDVEKENRHTEQENTLNISKGVKEALDIKIKENNVKDISFSLNTAESGKARFITPKINGSLKCIIIESPYSADIKISLLEYPQIILWEKISFEGIRYLPLRLNAMSNNDERFNFQTVSWALNNKLLVEVKSEKQKEVNFVVRYS